ncbi:MAG TPA: GDP-mannose 4,6-dehydratase, partial [Bacteroidales bacterium]|nr:GDP-mannose 4,6-dehydratase [Bacteroidales bacterium]
MRKICLITGSSGLIGSESVEFFSEKFDKIIGFDNNMREYFFGQEASTEWNTKRLENTVQNFEHHSIDIRDISGLEKIFDSYNSDIELIVHT